VNLQDKPPADPDVESDPVAPARLTPITPPPQRPLGQRLRRFSGPFFAVLGYYVVGVATFAIMASSNVPGNGEVSYFVEFAIERTSPFALLAALAAGYWWQ
jgi:hypothetical protein